MEYVYAALLLFKSGKDISEASVKAVLSAAGIDVDDSRIKALVAALDGVDITEAISKAAVAPVAIAVAPAGASAAAPVEEAAEPEENKAEKEESGMAGLGALFG